jgi:hypothetical protein
MKHAHRKDDQHPRDQRQRLLHKATHKAEYGPGTDQEENNDIKSGHAAGLVAPKDMVNEIGQ